MQDMTSGNPLKLILKFSIPLLIGNIFQQMYSISDIIIVGRLIGVKALAAVGVCAPLFFMLVVISIGFTNGLTIITAQRFGARDYHQMRRSVATATILSLMFTFSTSFLMLTFLDPLFHLMNVPTEIYQDAKNFISIIAYGASTIVVFNLLSGFLRAIGDSKSPLYFLMFSTIINITFNIILIHCYKLGVKGSAYGTIFAMLISVICCLFYIYKKVPQLIPQQGDWKLSYNFCKKHLVIALPMALQFSIIAISNTIIQSVCNTFGPDTIAAFISALRVEQLAMQPMVSVGIAIGTYVAQNYGAGMIGRIRRGVHQGFFISLYAAVILALLIGLFGSSLIGIFVSDHNQEIIRIGQTYLVITVLFYFFLSQIFLYRNALQGVGNAVIPLFSSLAELTMRIFAVLFLAPKFGYLGVCYANPIAWIGGSLVVFIGYFREVQKIRHRYQFKKPYVFYQIRHIIRKNK